MTPSILELLRDNLNLSSGAQNGIHSEQALVPHKETQIESHHTELVSDIHNMEEHLANSQLTKNRIEDCVAPDSTPKSIRNKNGMRKVQDCDGPGTPHRKRQLAGKKLADVKVISSS